MYFNVLQITRKKEAVDLQALTRYADFLRK